MYARESVWKTKNPFHHSIWPVRSPVCDLYKSDSSLMTSFYTSQLRLTEIWPLESTCVSSTDWKRMLEKPCRPSLKRSSGYSWSRRRLYTRCQVVFFLHESIEFCQNVSSRNYISCVFGKLKTNSRKSMLSIIEIPLAPSHGAGVVFVMRWCAVQTT